MHFTRPASLVLAAACALAALFSATTAHAQAPKPTPSASMAPDELFSAIRTQFRTHRPPPAFETYTIERKQNTNYGYPDYTGSYVYHVWVRNSDRAALTRKESRLGAHGPLTFKRPMFNIDDDPGPPTADLFEQAPPRNTTPTSFVPTPEPSGAPVIVTVRARYDPDYKVTKVAYEGNLVHVSVMPRRDLDRNRLREVWADAKTLELTRVIATDKLFVTENGRLVHVYPVTFTVDVEPLDGRPVVTHIHGAVGENYADDGQQLDFYFRDITFPATLPSWYFDPRSYASHQDDAPL